MWVHNGGPGDPLNVQEIFWGLGAGGPRARDMTKPSPDFDGASSWRTESEAEIGRMMGGRVAEAPTSSNSNMGGVTRAQLEAEGLVAVQTEGRGMIAEAGVQHYSIRPASNPDPAARLSQAEFDFVNNALQRITPAGKAKPKQFGC